MPYRTTRLGGFKAWARDFTEEGPPPKPDTEFPPVAELWTLLERTHKRLLDVLEAASPAELDRPPRVANPYFHTLARASTRPHCTRIIT